MRSILLKKTLDVLHKKSADVVVAFIIASDGLLVTSSLPTHLDRERTGTMAAAMLALGTRAAHEIGCGKLQQMLIKGDQGNLLVVQTGLEALLAAVIQPNAELDIVVEAVLQAAEAARRILI